MAVLSLPQGRDIAFALGRQDAAEGVVCYPEMYFAWRLDKVAYCEGYAVVAGHNDTTRWFLADDVRVVLPSGNAGMAVL